MAPQYIFTMKDLRKVTPQGKEILKGIWLSFYPTAKIGVLGANGAGKSTLLRIMAGVDKDFAGEAFSADGHAHRLPSPGAAARSQEDRPRDRRGGGGAPARDPPEVRGPLRELVGRERGRARPSAGPDRRPEPLGAGPPRRDGHGRAARPPGRRGREHALRRRAPPGGAVPPAAPAQRHAPARRADEPPRRGVGGLARAVPEGVQGQRRGRDPRPLLPRQRRGLDPGAGPRRRHPLGGQLLVLAGPEADPAVPGRERGVGPAAHPAARAGVGADVAPRAPGQGQGAPAALRGAAGRGAGSRRSARARARSRSRPARAWATSSSRPRSCARPTATSC